MICRVNFSVYVVFMDKSVLVLHFYPDKSVFAQHFFPDKNDKVIYSCYLLEGNE